MVQSTSPLPSDPSFPGTAPGKVPLISHDAGYGQVLAALAAAQKPVKGAPAYSRFVNRRLGRGIAAAAFRLHATPNMVTAVSASFSFAAIAVLALARPTFWVGLAVCLGLIIGYAFDSADGQLARLRGGGSPSGEWLDHVVDSAKVSSLHLAMLISFYRFSNLAPGWLLVPIGFTVVAAVMFFAMTLNDQLRRQQIARTGVPIDRGTTSSLRSLLVIPTDYGLLCVVFVLLGATHVFFWVYVVLFAANAAFMLLAAVKWFGDMKTLL